MATLLFGLVSVLLLTGCGAKNEIEARLVDKLFYRCHRSCIVNRGHIDEVDFKANVVRMKVD